ELLEFDRASGARLRAHIIRLETERAVEDRLERDAADFVGLCVSIFSAREHHVLPKLAPLERSVEDGELSVKHLAVATFAALEDAVLAGVTGMDVDRDG